MKLPRSFSLLTFLMVATIAAIAFALYQANNEAAETRKKFDRYSHQLGYINVEDESKLHVRRLGGHSSMSFAFQYYLPKKPGYQLFVGSGPIDPLSGRPPVLSHRNLAGLHDQDTVVINLQKMPTNFGKRWVLETVDCAGKTFRTVCDDPNEFTWLQTYLAAHPDKGSFTTPIGNSNSFSVSVHHPVQMFETDESPILYEKKEFHPTAEAAVPREMLKEREVFMIWLEPAAEHIKLEPPQQGRLR